MKDWKTTACGVVTILIGVLTFVVLPYLHGASVNVGGLMTAVTAGAGLIKASDSVPTATK